MTRPVAGDRRATVSFAAVVLLSFVVLFSVVHAGLFALLAATTWWRFAAHRVGLVAVILYGAASEVIQATLLPSRDGDVRDVVADAAGALLGWVLARKLSARRLARRDQVGVR
jgi:VanZ family protein